MGAIAKNPPLGWGGMRVVAVALVALALAGCVAGSSDKYFPPASDLPDGLVPVSTETSEWKLLAPFLGMESNPGHVAALDKLPKKDLGAVASVDAYLLQAPDDIQQSYGILVLRFNDTSEIGSALAEGEASACDNHEMAHVLHDGLVYVLVGGDGSTDHGRQVLTDLAGAVQARSGATLVC
jgi:hypothetical protein